MKIWDTLLQQHDSITVQNKLIVNALEEILQALDATNF